MYNSSHAQACSDYPYSPLIPAIKYTVANFTVLSMRLGAPIVQDILQSRQLIKKPKMTHSKIQIYSCNQLIYQGSLQITVQRGVGWCFGLGSE